MSTICPNCGMENTSARRICKRCRASLPVAEPAQPIAVAVAAPASASTWLQLWVAWVVATAMSGAAVGALEQVRTCDNFLLFYGLTPVLSWGGALLGWTQ